MMSAVAGSVAGYVSPTLLELSQLEDTNFKFDATLSDIFGVSCENQLKFLQNVFVPWNILDHLLLDFFYVS